MNSSRSIPVVGGNSVPGNEHPSTITIWSFGPQESQIVGWTSAPDAGMTPPESENGDNRTTLAPQAITKIQIKPVVLSKRNFGKRSFRVIAAWEGVVEEVTADGFRGRLIPIVNGRPNQGIVEEADFTFDEIAYEEDRNNAQPGAIFYWTIGRRMDAAGTLANTSLIRFRRRSPLGRYQMKRAESEAASMLHVLGVPDESQSAGL